MQISDGPHHEQTLEYSIVLTNLSPELTYLFKVWYIASNVYLNHETISMIHSTSAKDPVLTLLSVVHVMYKFLLLPAPSTHLPHSSVAVCSMHFYIFMFVVYAPLYLSLYIYKRRKSCEISVSNRQTSMKASCIFLHVHRSGPEHQ